jgi:hypothetical protein
MPDDPINLARIDDTRQAIETLEKSLTGWLDRWDKKDTRHQYKTLLSTLRLQLTSLVGQVRREMQSVTASSSRGAVYAECRLNEKRLLWIERLWTYFKDKLDQREHPTYGPILAAADEVVWSCYAAPFRATKRDHGPVPLPWIAAEYSPRAIPRSLVPQNLRDDVDSEFLAAMLDELPVPLVNMPPNCVREPWWLIYLAHEIGHQVQFELLPGQQLVTDFGAIVKGAIKDEETADRWEFRAKEIFADVFSIYMTGPWALWGLTELTWTTDADMVDDTETQYPSPAARLLLMSHVVEELGFDGAVARRNFPAATALDAIPGQAALVKAVAKAVMSARFADGKGFADLCSWNASQHKGAHSSVAEWVEAFLRNASRQPDETLSAARLALAGGVAAWAEISSDANVRLAKKDALARDLLKAVQRSHEPVERGAETETRAAVGASKPLMDLLFRSDRSRLGGS